MLLFLPFGNELCIVVEDCRRPQLSQCFDVHVFVFVNARIATVGGC